MRKFKFNIQGNQFEIEVINIEENIAEMLVNGQTIHVEVDKTLPQTKTPRLMRTPAIPSTDSSPSGHKTNPPGGPKGSGTIKSPLPGTIIAIHVRQGDAVRIGQKLLTLEAMKMENDIKSDKEGTVTNIKVNQGDNVMEGDILITIS